MYKFFKKRFANFFIIPFIILVLTAAVLLVSCSKATHSNEKIAFIVPDVGKVNEDFIVHVEPLEPGVSKIILTFESTDTNLTTELKSYPYKYSWKPQKPGVYNIKIQALSLLDGSRVSKEKRVTIYDVAPPVIEDVKIIPARPYQGDEVLLQIKVGSRNPIIKLITKGVVLGSSSTNSFFVEPGYNYIRLGRLNSDGDVEMFLRTEAYDTQDATTLNLSINSIDRIGPEITVFADTFYSPDSNITVRVTLRDNVRLKRYKVTFDGQTVLEKNIAGTQYSEEIFIGSKETGTHAINVLAEDAEGNMSTFAKRIYVGGTALRFKVELSPSELVAGRTAVIAMIPQERDVVYKKVVYLVDGRKIVEYPNESVNYAQLFTLWEIEEGEHYITIYAESQDGRAGIAETTISVRDYNGPRFVSLYATYANGEKRKIELKLGQVNYIIPGMVNFELTVEDPGGISLTTKPKLLIRENLFDFYFREIDMEVYEVSGDLRRVTFNAQTMMPVGYYYITLANVADKSGNLMRNIGSFLVFVE